MKNSLKWFETEYCGRADETIQPVQVNETLFYTLFDLNGFTYVFASIYSLCQHMRGEINQYEFTCGNEDDLIEYLEEL